MSEDEKTSKSAEDNKPVEKKNEDKPKEKPLVLKPNPSKIAPPFVDAVARVPKDKLPK